MTEARNAWTLGTADVMRGHDEMISTFQGFGLAGRIRGAELPPVEVLEPLEGRQRGTNYRKTSRTNARVRKRARSSEVQPIPSHLPRHSPFLHEHTNRMRDRVEDTLVCSGFEIGRVPFAGLQQPFVCRSSDGAAAEAMWPNVIDQTCEE